MHVSGRFSIEIVADLRQFRYRLLKNRIRLRKIMNGSMQLVYDVDIIFWFLFGIHLAPYS
jgi:hypothetical protein